MWAKFGCGPTVVSKKKGGYRQTDRQADRQRFLQLYIIEVTSRDDVVYGMVRGAHVTSIRVPVTGSCVVCPVVGFGRCARHGRRVWTCHVVTNNHLRITEYYISLETREYLKGMHALD